MGVLEDHPHLAKMIDTFIDKERFGRVRMLLGAIFGGGGTAELEAEKVRLQNNLHSMGYQDCCIKAILPYAHREIFTALGA